MFRTLVVITASAVALGCASDDAASENPSGGRGGASGAGAAVSASTTVGGAGSAGAGGASASSSTTATGTGGMGGGSGDGGSRGNGASTAGDSGGAGGDASVDARDVSIGDTQVRDASAEGDGNPGGDGLPGRPWIHLCPKTDTHEQCCAFLCSCLATVCADSPLDKMGIDNCMTNCPKLTDMAMRCHVYHCYESLNPRVPQDHVSHCGHASGRVGGGGCPPEVYGP